MRFPGNDHPATLSKIVDEIGKVMAVWENSSLEKNRNTDEIRKIIRIVEVGNFTLRTAAAVLHRPEQVQKPGRRKPL
ncbi:hypothetical protein SAMN02910340_01251 [Methanosarcina thermophila]|jgi:hypothetical protein|uniref:Uncharacterized protein n=1 Tax=Methanosarcina thermophila TaxID=2210 RepID=A0A1I6Z3D5_METTE|nr:conserved hypothetical protein [Methanosarcina thermophila]GLI14781.1 hypothetical protein MTHERMMSTA1_19070 [Methanosarcina thermophila MST-A1]SFT57174.1 hypothetical protein SAMN02910340_01251 [Methanosarcina thermophila]